jgi:hypothetical protein
MFCWKARRTPLKRISHDPGQLPLPGTIPPPHQARLELSSCFFLLWLATTTLLLPPTIWRPHPVDNSRVPLPSPLLLLSKLPPKQAHVRSSIPTPMHYCNADASSIKSIQPIATTSEEEGVLAPVDEACHHKTFFQMHATLRTLNSIRVLFEVPNCFTSQPPRHVLLLVGCLTAVSRLFVIPMEGCQ